MAWTVAVTGGTLVTGEGRVRADLLLRDERVVTWLAADAATAMTEVDERIDATGLWVLPGGIDVHTHFEEPDPNLLEGFETGSRAAAAGGITTVVEMPQAHPTTTTAELLREKAAMVARSAIVDVALWAGVTFAGGQTEADLEAMAAAGAAAFKSFMASSSPFFPAVDTGGVLRAMEVAAATGLPYGLHAEDDALLRHGIGRMKRANRVDPMAHAESRPPVVETVAVAAALVLAEETGAPLHVCHVASAGALRLIADAKRRGVKVTCETCPQYLVLDTGDLERLRGFARCAPALRPRAEVDAIWPFVLDGTVDLLCSDHCGVTPESKRRGDEDIFAAPLGLPGVQTLLPASYTGAVVERGMEPERWVRLVSARPAAIFGLAPRKGSLAIGADADLVLFDPERRWTVTVEDHAHRQPWSPYEGMTLQGRVVRTIRRGETIFDDGKPGRERFTAAAGSGRFVPRVAS
ncbi:MAG: allantoinase AllB [Chloroflexia bacterium]|nr:allantoinase AllB [Chloroflexia bacterium]